MTNLYHKVAVASICMTLSFTLGANQEAKGATITLTTTPFFIEGASDYEGGGDAHEYALFRDGYSVEQINNSIYYPYSSSDTRAFYEFNIGNLSLDTNTVIKRAILNTPLSNVRLGGSARSIDLELFGYVGNGIPDLSDFYAGVPIGFENAVTWYPIPYRPIPQINFDVTNFINQRVSNGDGFAGLGIRVRNAFRNGGTVTLLGAYGEEPTLTIETADVAEPVPEPTTIFGSALALGVGGWLKRKKSSQHNKTTPQD
jgi:hypothetical protein